MTQPNDLLITIDVASALERLRANRDKYNAMMAESDKEWRAEAARIVSRWLDDVRAGNPVSDHPPFVSRDENHLEDYDLMIAQFANHVELEAIVPTEVAYAMFQDHWPWTVRFFRYATTPAVRKEAIARGIGLYYATGGGTDD